MRSLAVVALIALVACSFTVQASDSIQPDTAAAKPNPAAAAQGVPADPGAGTKLPTEASKPSAATQVSTDAQPAAATQAAQPAGEAANSTGEAAKPKDDTKTYRPPPGYKAAIRVSDGERVYCRNEDVIDTRFKKRVCYSEIELEQVRARNESEANDITRRSRVCVTGSVCINR